MEKEQPEQITKLPWTILNRDKLALNSRKYYEKMKHDEEFMEKKREQSRIQRKKRRLRKLELKLQESLNKPEEPAPEPEIKPEPELKVKKANGRPRKYQ